MPVTESIGRRQCIPIIYTRGTHYEVGFDVGRTFGNIIRSFIQNCKVLNQEFLPAYETPEGKQGYEDTLKCLKQNFPQYIKELEGTADGANVPFHKLFLMHMDAITLYAAKQNFKKEAVGCSTVCINQEDQQILAHNEDQLSDALNHFYFVSAHIISDKPQGKWKITEEKFTSLCYAGHLPGYTMSYNHHGLIFTINTLSARKLQPGKTPRHFITRALLAAENYSQAQQVLRDEGCGAADGCSINMTFLNQEGCRMFHNIEMAPAVGSESQLNILTASPGEHFLHCNSYLRIPVDQTDEMMQKSSEARMGVLKSYKKPKTRQDVINMLGDQTHSEYRVYQDFGPDDIVKTLATGIFDCREKTWTLYADNPKKTEPLIVLPLNLKSTTKVNSI